MTTIEQELARLATIEAPDDPAADAVAAAALREGIHARRTRRRASLAGAAVVLGGLAGLGASQLHAVPEAVPAHPSPDGQGSAPRPPGTRPPWTPRSFVPPSTVWCPVPTPT